jgi:hypothetical protein
VVIKFAPFLHNKIKKETKKRPKKREEETKTKNKRTVMDESPLPNTTPMSPPLKRSESGSLSLRKSGSDANGGDFQGASPQVQRNVIGSFGRMYAKFGDENLVQTVFLAWKNWARTRKLRRLEKVRFCCCVFLLLLSLEKKKEMLILNHNFLLSLSHKN